MNKSHKKAIVTLAIGDGYIDMFRKYCYSSWNEYCDKFGYDLILITSPLDDSPRAHKRSASWQKLLILSQEWSLEYDRIVWIDSDVIINNSYAYDICDGVPMDMVGAVDAYSIPSKEIHDIALSRLYSFWRNHSIPFLDNDTPSKYYTNRGINGNDLCEVVQAGVFVCSPGHHKTLFEKIYYGYEDTHGAEWNYEMPAMSYELIKNNAVHWISPRFNFCVSNIEAAFYNGMNPSDYLLQIYHLSIFMHFAGCTNKMPIIDQLLK